MSSVVSPLTRTAKEAGPMGRISEGESRKYYLGRRRESGWQLPFSRVFHCRPTRSGGQGKAMVNLSSDHYEGSLKNFSLKTKSGHAI